jgi:hypothetical protein
MLLYKIFFINDTPTSTYRINTRRQKCVKTTSSTKWWIEKQERPLCFQISSFTTSCNKEVEKVRPS